MKKLTLLALLACMPLMAPTGKRYIPTLDEIRKAFLEYFMKEGFVRVEPKSVVTPDGKIIGSAATAFKDFIMHPKGNPSDIITIQYCIRAYGHFDDKPTVRASEHHVTYFPSLAFFSQNKGSYRRNIYRMVLFLIEHLGLDRDRFYVTMHKDDREAALAIQGLMQEGKLLQGHSFAFDEENMWKEEEHGGLRGFSTEFFIDQRPEKMRQKRPIKKDFMNGNLLELASIVSYKEMVSPAPYGTPPPAPMPVPCCMNGKSLSPYRIPSALNPVSSTTPPPSLYDLPEIKPIMHSVEKATSKNYNTADKETRAAMRVITDHMRTAVVLMANGVKTSDKTEAGTCLRGLLEEAQNAAKTIAPKKAILPHVTRAVIKVMKPTHPEIGKKSSMIIKAVQKETNHKK